MYYNFLKIVVIYWFSFCFNATYQYFGKIKQETNNLKLFRSGATHTIRHLNFCIVFIILITKKKKINKLIWAILCL